jgi:hypothetical protein
VVCAFIVAFLAATVKHFDLAICQPGVAKGKNAVFLRKGSPFANNVIKLRKTHSGHPNNAGTRQKGVPRGEAGAAGD